jgi:hypothetical protein
MTQPIFPDLHTISAYEAFPLPQFITRTRREYDSKDTINARQFEHWQTKSAQGIYNRPDPNQPKPFHDVLPNSSRLREYDDRPQPRFDSEGDKGIQNPYFDKYDSSADSRNMIRELRSSVYENKKIEFEKESTQMLKRSMENRWNTKSVKIDAMEQLRPQRDDIRIFYQSKTNSTGV